jgi:hypothetical protein
LSVSADQRGVAEILPDHADARLIRLEIRVKLRYAAAVLERRTTPGFKVGFCRQALRQYHVMSWKLKVVVDDDSGIDLLDRCAVDQEFYRDQHIVDENRMIR